MAWHTRTRPLNHQTKLQREKGNDRPDLFGAAAFLQDHLPRGPRPSSPPRIPFLSPSRIQAYMDHHGFPASLRSKVRAYFKRYFNMRSALDEKAILNDLDPELRQEVRHHDASSPHDASQHAIPCHRDDDPPRPRPGAAAAGVELSARCSLARTCRA